MCLRFYVILLVFYPTYVVVYNSAIIWDNVGGPVAVLYAYYR